MKISVHAFDVMGQLRVSVAQSDALPDGSDSPLYARAVAHIVIPQDVQEGTWGDQLAFLAECLLDVAYERGAGG